MQNVEFKPRENAVEQVDKRYIYDFIKRSFDIIASFCALIIFSPVYLIISILVKLDSDGPVFFKQERYGYRGSIIKIYKFRTMVINAEELLKKLSPEQKKEFQENFKLDNDFRITKIGRILRSTSLDELPQLFNILKGDMSFVGPRPVIKKEIVKYGDYADKFLSVKPGLTGYWQVNGRSNTTYEQRIKLDMKYIDKRNLLMDLKIILKTVIVVFQKVGAK